MEHARDTVGLVVPLYNEEDVLPSLISEIETYRIDHPEIEQVVFIDDGSVDGTARLVKDLTAGREGYLLVRFSRNFGHQIAVTAGLHMVETDAAVVMDADLQDPLWVVTEMIDKWREGFDVVYGIRQQRDGEPWLRRTAMKLFYRYFRHMSDIDAPADTGDFRLLSRPVIDAFRRLEERQPYVRGLVSWIGFNQTGIEYHRPARAAGRSKYSYRHLIRLATDGITAFSHKPLRYAAGIGMGTSLLAAAGLVWVVLDKLLFGAERGWASIIFAVFFFSGLQLFFLGIVGVYIARVYEEVKARPRYIVREEWNSESQPLLSSREGPEVVRYGGSG